MNISLQIAADTAELEVLHSRLEELQSAWLLPKKTIAEINLLLEEHIVNIINHGKLDRSHIIDISLAKIDDQVTITVIDDGPPFDPTLHAAPDVTLPLEQRQCGGLGIHLVRKICNCCSYSRISGKNILTLAKNISKECR